MGRVANDVYLYFLFYFDLGFCSTRVTLFWLLFVTDRAKYWHIGCLITETKLCVIKLVLLEKVIMYDWESIRQKQTLNLITKVSRIYPLWTLNVCHKFHSNPSNSIFNIKQLELPWDFDKTHGICCRCPFILDMDNTFLFRLFRETDDSGTIANLEIGKEHCYFLFPAKNAGFVCNLIGAVQTKYPPNCIVMVINPYSAK